MAIGNKDSNSGKSVFFVKIVRKDDEGKEIEPYFSFRQKQADGSYKEVQQNTSFSGNLTKVSTGVFTYEGVDSPQAKISLEDGAEVYVADLSYNLATRGLFNAILALDNYENIRINVYKTKPNAEGKRFVALSLWQNNENVKWKYAFTDLPAIKKLKLGKKEVVDSSDVDDFFTSALEVKFNGKKAAEPTKGAESDQDSPL